MVADDAFQGLSPARIAAFGLLGIALNLSLTWFLVLPNAAGTGRNDFLGFYAGGKLAGPDLYNPEKLHQVHTQALGETSPLESFVRFPFFGLLLKPLTFLPYSTAYRIWLLISTIALIGALALWPGPDPALKWLVVCWSLPALVGIFNGQDVALVLFWIALATRLVDRWPFAAGLALAMATSKYHLLVLIPVVILAQRRWRLLAGAAAGVGAILAISMAVVGWSWPAQYLELVGNPIVMGDQSHSPSFHVYFSAIPSGVHIEAAAVLALAFVVYRISRRAGWNAVIGLYALPIGILVSPHSWLADCTLLIPALILSGSTYEFPEHVPAPAALLTPLPWLGLNLVPPFPLIPRLLMVWLVAAGSVRRARLLRADEYPTPEVTK